MEEVSFDSHGTKYVLVDGQAVILQKNLHLNNIPDVNVDILQGALNGVNISSNKNVDCLQSSLSSDGLNCIGNNEFVIVNEAQKTESDKIVQLSIQETNDLGLQFSMEASEIKGSTPKEGSQNDLSESYFYQNPVNINESVNDEGAINVQNVLDLGNYNDLMLPALSDNVNQQVTLIPHYVNGQLSYTLQLNDQNNPFDFTQIQSIGNDNILNSTGMNEITEKNVPMASLLKCTPVSIAPLLPNLDQSSTLEKVIASAGYKMNGGTITSHEPTIVNQGKEPVTYILPAKALLTNSKPRILASTKNSQRNIIKLMEANKNIQPKVKIQPSKNQLLLLSNKRKIAPLKMALPPLNPSIKKRNISSANPKQVLIKSILKNDSSNSTINTNLSNNVLKQQLIAGKSIITPKNIESVSKGNVRLNIRNEVSVPKEDFTVAAPSIIELDGKEVQSSGVNDKQPIRRLTQSQLKQIASVLQKNRNNQGGLTTPSTLYDTETNTRIICRVVYPEDFGSENKTINLTKKRGRPSKCKEPSEVSSEKKPSCEERKKQLLPRTRSGRLSRPPRHMVKDYKRLQGDDSDDAYSDYVSEAEENSENTVAVNLLPGLSQRQKRNISSQFRCPTCNKIYLGHERMRWHFEKYPDHGDDKYMHSLPPPLPEIEGVNNTKPTINRKGFGLTRGRRRFKRLHPESLKDVIKGCDDGEVVGAAGSTVAKVLTAWELLLLRLDAVRNDKSKVATLCEELNNIVQKVREAAEHFLQPKLNSDHEGETFSLEDDTLSSIFGIPKGTYITNDAALEKVNLDSKVCMETKSDNFDHQANNQKKFKVDVKPEVVPQLETKELKCDPPPFLLNSEMLCEKSFPPVDKSDTGLDSVDQIVSERLQTLAPVDDVMNCLALPDNNRSLDSSDDIMAGILTSVESMASQSLTDTIIFTPPNESRLSGRNHVSDSTEDLMKSLENLSREIQVQDTNNSTLTATDIDFTVLSQEFSSGR